MIFLSALTGRVSGQEVVSPEKVTAVQTLAVETERALVPVGASLNQVGLALKASSSNEKAELAVAASRTQTCPSSRLPRSLTRSQQQELMSLQNQVIDVLRSGSQAKLGEVASGIVDLSRATGDISVICGVMYRAITPAEARTLELAQRLQRNLDAKRQLHETITEIRDVITDDVWPTEVTYFDVEKTNRGSYRVVKRTVGLGAKQHAKNLVGELEVKLLTVADMTQMLQMQLQDAMNKQQEAMRLLSAIMKNQHDTLKAIISNLK